MPNPTARFETSEGAFEAEIYLDRVPYTSSNFIDLCRQGFYDGLHFHRVIDGFMVQFGCPNSKDPWSKQAGKGGPSSKVFPNLVSGQPERRTGGMIKDEHKSYDSNVVGTLAMANVGVANSGGSQFFFNVGHNHALDWFTPSDSKHPVFAIVRKSMDVVTKISKIPTDSNSKPVQPIQMIKVTVSGAPEVSLQCQASSSGSSSSSSSSTSPRTRKKKAATALRFLDRMEKDARTSRADNIRHGYLDRADEKPSSRRKRSSSSSSHGRRRTRRR